MPRPHDKPLHARRRLAWLAAGLGCYLLLLILQRHPWAVERVYATGFSPLLTRAISRLFGTIPFPLFEIVIVVVIAPLLAAAVRATYQVIRRTRSRSNVLARGALRVARDAGVLITLFYVIWGFNYVRPRLDARLGYSSGTVATTEELTRLTRQLVDASNAAYVELRGSIDGGTPTTMPSDRRPLLVALDSGWRRATVELKLASNNARAYGQPKSPVSSTLARHMGITGGIFFPFTGEALFIADLPAHQLVKTIAHEQAHQRGTAVEGDANALAFFVCAWSPDPLARYSGLSFAREQMLLELARTDAKAFRTEYDRIAPGVQRDRAALREYWRRTRVPSSELATRVNDAGLRLNRVREGVRSYSRSTLIFIEFARSRHGVIVPS